MSGIFPDARIILVNRIVSIDALRNLQPSGDNFEQMMSEMRRAGRFGSIH